MKLGSLLKHIHMYVFILISKGNTTTVNTFAKFRERNLYILTSWLKFGLGLKATSDLT